MILICCVDDRMGMTFNHRRQSQDRLLRQRVLELSGGSLWMNEYTARQFADAEDKTIVDPDFTQDCPKGAYCFVEDIPVFDLKPERIILYRWNRTYPADTYFDIPLQEWRLLSTSDFPGYSHARITEEVYIR